MWDEDLRYCSRGREVMAAIHEELNKRNLEVVRQTGISECEQEHCDVQAREPCVPMVRLPADAAGSL